MSAKAFTLTKTADLLLRRYFGTPHYPIYSETQSLSYTGFLSTTPAQILEKVGTLLTGNTFRVQTIDSAVFGEIQLYLSSSSERLPGHLPPCFGRSQIQLVRTVSSGPARFELLLAERKLLSDALQIDAVQKKATKYRCYN
jgi:hypothetical protein